MNASSSSLWPAAVQNLTALLCTTYLAKIEVISGNAASMMILGILGVIAIPALKAPKSGTGTSLPPGGTGTVGVFALLALPAIRAAASIAGMVAGRAVL